MTTVVHNDTGAATGTDSSLGLILGIIMLAIVLFLAAYYVLPMMNRGSGGPSAPAPQVQGGTDNGGTNVTLPDKIDVNLNQNN